MTYLVHDTSPFSISYTLVVKSVAEVMGFKLSAHYDTQAYFQIMYN